MLSYYVVMMIQLKNFFIQNSWGTDVGKQGYFTIPYKYVLDPNLASDFWVFTLFK